MRNKIIKAVLDLKEDKKLIEGLVVSLIAAWIIISIINGCANHIDDRGFAFTKKTYILGLEIGISSVIFLLIYAINQKMVRVLMFAESLIFSSMMAMKTYYILWSGLTHNMLGDILFIATLAGIEVAIFMYVKNDIFEISDSIDTLSKNQTWVCVGFIGLFIFAIAGITTVLRYKTYCTSTFDFGIFAQMFESMKRDFTMTTTLERNRVLTHFAVHFSPILYLGLPIYMLCPRPETVQLIQALMVALPVIPITLLARHFNFSDKKIIALNAIYALYPITIQGTFHDFHENCFLTFLILMVAYAVEKKKNILLIIFTLLTVLVKEDAPIYIGIIGMYLLFSRKDKKRGAILILASMVFFAIEVSLVKSHGLGILDDRFINLYKNDDGSITQIIPAIIGNPGYILTQIVSNEVETDMDKLRYVIIVAVSIAKPVLSIGRKYSKLILLLPFLLLNLMTTYVYLHDITYQYNFGCVALAMYLIILNISDMPKEKRRVTLWTTLICVIIMFMGLTIPEFSYYTSKMKTQKTVIEKLDEGIGKVEDGSVAVAGGFVSAKLYDHKEVYDIRHMNDEEKQTIGTDYIVVDNHFGMDDELNEAVNNAVATGNYKKIYNVDGVITVYKKN